MRTTLDLDEDVLESARKLARQRGETMGRVISDLARASLGTKEAPKIRNGMQLLTRKPGAPKVTMEFVNQLRDEE